MLGKLQIIVGVLLVAALAATFFLARAFFVPALVTLAVGAALWFGIDFGMKLWRRKKEAAFDEDMAAREGIEDRRSEWANWTTELKNQGIDRYELPFYLVVGEPQSGKSVLLQNSDLHFPFGQSKLSGIGGTRGCDWWFTEEAVLLDLAGRLFTHEGGGADEAEWEAFLDMLAAYRPLCPANGVVLVIPCDSLLSDSPEQLSSKATQIQKALFTLTNRLQAQLPVYLVLTKGDRIFGFAESVHRLETQRRHEMFGWSRTAEAFDTPFNLEEVRSGFGGMVDRSRALRTHMLATARLPEALGEVDRLYAFPEELQALWVPLEVYLQRIFTESSLVDRVFFRGFYLTSGLQSGVPVARVCADLLGEAGEADLRRLEGLFSKQRAYFIKDLIRKRVFSERGLVRPTQRRVTKARRLATVGYGAAAVIALLSVVLAIAHVSGERDSELTAMFESAEEGLAYAAGPTPDVRGLLDSLGRVQAAESADTGATDAVFGDLPTVLADAYRGVFDERLAAELRRQAELEASTRLAAEPASYAEFETRLSEIELLSKPIDFGDAATVAGLTSVVPARMHTGRSSDGSAGFELGAAIKKRASYGTPPHSPPALAGSGDEERLRSASARALALFDGVLTPGAAWQVGGDLGYALAWMGLASSARAFELPRVDGDDDVHDRCETFVSSRARLDEIKLPELESGGRGLRLEKAKTELGELMNRHNALMQSAVEVGVVFESSRWPEHDALASFLADLDAPKGGAGVAAGLTAQKPSKGAAVAAGLERAASALGGGEALAVPTEELAAILARGELVTACAASFLAAEPFAPGKLAPQIASGRKLTDPLAANVVRRKLDVLQRTYAGYADWRAVVRDLGGKPKAAGEVALDAALVDHLAGLVRELEALDATRFSEWIDRADGFLAQHLREARNDWDAVVKATREANWALVDGLRAAGQTTRASAQPARDLLARYLEEVRDAAFAFWDAQEDHGTFTLEMIREFTALNNELAQRLDEHDPQIRRWRQRVDAMLAGRLEKHTKELARHWQAESDFADVSEAARKVLAAIESSGFRDLLKLDKLSAPDLDDALLKKDSPLFTSNLLPDSTKALKELHRWRPPVSASGTASNEYVEWVRDFVERFSSTGGADRGPALAKRLWTHTSSGTSAPLPPENAAGLYVSGLHAAFHRVLVRQIGELYLKDVSHEIVGAYGFLFDALLADDLGELHEALESTTDKKIVKELGEIFDRDDGLLDLLRERYYLTAEPPLVLRPADLEASPNRNDWLFERFLGELQVFLLGEGGDEVRRSEFTVILTPVHEDLWSTDDRGKAYLVLTHYDKQGYQYRIRPCKQITDEEFDWSLRSEQGKKLLLRWTAVAVEGPPGPEDAAIDIPGSLAPFMLAWWDGDKASDGWNVSLEFDKHPGADFKLGFRGRSLPERPKVRMR